MSQHYDLSTERMELDTNVVLMIWDGSEKHREKRKVNGIFIRRGQTLEHGLLLVLPFSFSPSNLIREERDTMVSDLQSAKSNNTPHWNP